MEIVCYLPVLFALLVAPEWTTHLTTAAAQTHSLQINVSTSHESNNNNNIVTIVCYYHLSRHIFEADVNLSESVGRTERSASSILFVLNETIMSPQNKDLSHYNEWDFEYGAMAQFMLPKLKGFVGTFHCKNNETVRERSSKVTLIYSPVDISYEHFRVIVYSLIVISSILFALLIITVAVCLVTIVSCHRETHSASKCIERQSNLKDLDESARYQVNTASLNFSNIPHKMPDCLRDLQTGQVTMKSQSTESCLPLQQPSYIDPPEDVLFDSNGGRYLSADHEVELYVPPFAIPVGKIITVRIAVSLTASLHFPLGMKPVSPIVHLSVVDDPNFTFSKPVKVIIPHFLSISPTDSNKSIGLQFVKAHHDQSSFQVTDGQSQFQVGRSYGTLSTDHFCHFCITSNVSNFSKANFRLIRITPRSPSSTWKAQFCVTYFLRTCLRSVEKFYDASEYEVTSLKRFTFTHSLENSSLQIHFERKLAGGWNLTQAGGSNKVLAREVDFWGIEDDVLTQMEAEELYPPRFVIQINGDQATEAAHVMINFTGAIEELQTELSAIPRAVHYWLPESQSLPSDLSTISQTEVYRGCYAANCRHLFSYHRDDRHYSSREPLESFTDPDIPTHRFLMNNIAVEIPSKWRAVGTQLGIRNGILNQIEQDYPTDAQRRFSEVFSHWERQPTDALPYTWSSMFEVLNSPQVSENKLARNVELLQSATASNTSLASNKSGTGL